MQITPNGDLSGGARAPSSAALGSSWRVKQGHSAGGDRGVLFAADLDARRVAEAAAQVARSRADRRGQSNPAFAQTPIFGGSRAVALLEMLTAGEALGIDGPVAAPSAPRPASRGVNSLSTYLSMNQFNFGGAENVGGQTGSVAVSRNDEENGPKYQLKYSVLHGTSLKALYRREKAGGLDSENLSEMIGSSVARSISKALVASEGRSGGGAQTPGAQAAASDRIPTVSLVIDSQTGRTAVASRYLDTRGDLDKLYKKVTEAPDRHIHIERAPDASAPRALPGHWRPNASQARQVCDVLAMSALLGDHDVNPGNLVELHDGSIGRIDFGHAFNDLITGMGGKSTGGGGVQDPGGNRIRDYFNRSTVSHALPSHQIPKVWRHYKGFVPSETLGDALLAVADEKNDAVLGLTEASAKILDLVEALAQSEDGRQQHEALHLAHSIEAMAAKCPLADVNYKPFASQVKNPLVSKPPDPRKMISGALVHLSRFLEEGHRQMTKVGVACKLQGMIKARLEAGETVNWNKLRSEGLALLGTHKLAAYEPLPWLRFSLDEKPFDGSFMAYIGAQPKSAL